LINKLIKIKNNLFIIMLAAVSIEASANIITTNPLEVADSEWVSLSASGQSAYTGDSYDSWNNLEFNYFNWDHTSIAYGDLYLLDKEYLGNVDTLGVLTDGFIGMGVSDGVSWKFDSSIIIDSMSTYWFYATDVRNGLLLSGYEHDRYSGGSLYYAPNNSSFIKYDTWDQAFVLSGNVIDLPTPVPEPSTLAIFALGMMGLVSRRFKKK
jgi:hypothetical protein